MEKEKYSFKDSVRKSFREFFLPFRSGRANIIAYAIYIASVIAMTAIPWKYDEYEKDMQRYETRELDKRPELTDYTGIGMLERWLSSDEQLKSK